MTDREPLIAHWDRGTSRDDATGVMTVQLVAEDGTPVALVLDDDLREALGALLVDPDGDDMCEDCGSERGDIVACCRTCGTMQPGSPWALPCDNCEAPADRPCSADCAVCTG